MSSISCFWISSCLVVRYCTCYWFKHALFSLKFALIQMSALPPSLHRKYDHTGDARAHALLFTYSQGNDEAIP